MRFVEDVYKMFLHRFFSAPAHLFSVLSSNYLSFIILHSYALNRFVLIREDQAGRRSL
jgi:hypothetical protein